MRSTPVYLCLFLLFLVFFAASIAAERWTFAVTHGLTTAGLALLYYNSAASQTIQGLIDKIDQKWVSTGLDGSVYSLHVGPWLGRVWLMESDSAWAYSVEGPACNNHRASVERYAKAADAQAEVIRELSEAIQAVRTVAAFIEECS